VGLSPTAEFTAFWKAPSPLDNSTMTLALPKLAVAVEVGRGQGKRIRPDASRRAEGNARRGADGAPGASASLKKSIAG
jgi:hypothetical protein